MEKNGIILQILKLWIELFPKLIKPCSNLEITEVESFYLSERRFFVKSKTDNRFCFIRVSDFGFVEPRLSNTLFHRLMVDKFGKEYIDSFEKYLFSNLEVEGVPKFIAKCHERIEKRVTELLVYLNYTSK